MKASVQYNDYLGTAAADFVDSSSLEDYLKRRGVDTERYWPVGVELDAGNDGYVSLGFICLDRERNCQAVKVCFESKDRLEDFIGLFKRLNVVLTWAKGSDKYADLEPAEDPVYIDDRK